MDTIESDSSHTTGKINQTEEDKKETVHPNRNVKDKIFWTSDKKIHN